MIYEERDYTIYPGKLTTVVGPYRDHGVKFRKKYLGKFVAYLVPELGELYHSVANWGIKSLDQRAKMRAEMLKDLVWTDYPNRVDGLFQSQNTRILNATDFASLQ